MGDFPTITFGLIVLNGEPFTRYLLRAIYPFAHQIIAVEGAAPAAYTIASEDGHSRDGTLQTLRAFQAAEDPDGKLLVVTAEDEGHANGFWPGEKDEQSRAYVRRATGDYIWQVDVDEFYQPTDIQAILDLLRADPEISGVSFRQLTFWGGFDYWADGWYLWRHLRQIHRIFKWRPGFTYLTHRPPTILDEHQRNLRTQRWVSGFELERRGIYMYHYSLVFPRQVDEKCQYYGRAEWAHRQHAEKWAREVYLGLKRPFRVHNVYYFPSWLNRFSGSHPPQVEAMRADIAGGVLDVAQRPTADIERLLASRRYQVGRALLRKTLWAAEPYGQALVWRARLISFLTNPRRALRRLGQRLLGQAPT